MTINDIKVRGGISGEDGLLYIPYVDVKKSIEKYNDKYRWHDLRKNPDDLPKEDHEVEVIANMLCKWDKQYREFTIRMSYRRKIMYGKPIGWGVGYPYDFDYETDCVIAWREIEPFVEV